MEIQTFLSVRCKKVSRALLNMAALVTDPALCKASRHTLREHRDLQGEKSVENNFCTFPKHARHTEDEDVRLIVCVAGELLSTA